MANDIKLILTDIDGTILPYGQRSVSARTRAAFHVALDLGDPEVLVTLEV